MDDHSKLAAAQDRCGTMKHILLGCIDDRRRLRAELHDRRDKLEFLDELCRGPQCDAWVNEHRRTLDHFEDMRKVYCATHARIRRLDEAVRVAEADLVEMESRLRRQQECQGGSATHHHHRRPTSSSGRGNGPPYSSRAEKSERGSAREAYTGTDSSYRSRRSSMPRHTQPRYEYHAPDEGRSSTSRRPSMPQPRCEYRRPDDHYFNHEHSIHGTPDTSSRSSATPPRAAGASRTSPLPFPPSQQTIRSWRQCVDDCFADYSKIQEFPHPPVVKDKDREKNLNVIFSTLRGYDLKRERLRWHPDRFSACCKDKQEEWKEVAKSIFVVMNRATEERER
ncbi:hypothetical protein DOTSEDRAFT_36967 [Dothistroma septosporum NZE10]|uniref:Uncharacterized protein n=1 Tax=Dothistroma septosporum (strain NZE10 / CBS 128990) TaxID=675120 RepID=N1PGU6_DOTSN|nr:hypothetical protein DOTSEDRAFT_36967 [Dothistroma septosporum NZE10]